MFGKPWRSPKLWAVAATGMTFLALASSSVWAEAKQASLGDVKLVVGTNGPSELRAGGINFLANSSIRVRRVRVTNSYRNPYDLPDPYVADTREFRDAAVVPTGKQVDAKARCIIQTYPWGAVKVTYTPTKNRLNLVIQVQNTSTDVIEELGLDLLDLTLLQDTSVGLAYTSAGQGPNRGFNIGEPMLLTAAAKSGPMIVICSPQPDRPLGLQLTKNNAGSFTLSASVGDERQREIYDGVWNVRAIKPNAAETILVSLLFGPQGSDPYDLAADVCRGFGKAHPMLLNWPDRRPILGVMPSKGGAADWKMNPRGWWWEPAGKSIYTPEGRASFQAWMDAFTDAVISSAKRSGGQGVIFWNIEGGQWFWHAYYGAPELTPYLAPEMDEIADHICKKITDAGLSVGFCIRPTEIFPVVKTGTGDEKMQLPSWTRVDDTMLGELKPYYGDMPFNGAMPVDDAHIERSPVARLNAKIMYAKKRWGATLFYIDSDGYDRPIPSAEQKDGKTTQWRTLSAKEWQTLCKMHPDVLLIPEHEYDEYWSATAPYQQPPKYGGMTKHDINLIYPDAFSTIALFGGMEGQEDIAAHMPEYTAALQHGDLILYAGWMAPPQPVLDVYSKAAALAPIKVQIDRDGTTTIQGRATKSTEALKQAVTKLVTGKPISERRVLIRFDKQIDGKTLASIMADIGHAGAIIAWSQPLD